MEDVINNCASDLAVTEDVDGLEDVESDCRLPHAFQEWQGGYHGQLAEASQGPRHPRRQVTSCVNGDLGEV